MAIGTLTKWLMRLVESSRLGVPLLRRQQKDVKHSLLADLIIDKVLINSVANTY